jgi:hypothetical protein
MNIRAFRMQFTIVLSFALAACGGGGGGGNQNPPPQSQTISFAQAGPLTLQIGATVTNAASGGGGTGAITYQSSNTSVLTVDAASGLATGISVGSATVTATKAADTSFSQAQATYTVNVTLVPQAIAFAQEGTITVLLGSTLTNPASGGNGTGAITYESSDPAVATVGATSGIVTSVAKGTATVTATKAADATFAQAQATYTVKARTSTPLTGFISEISSEMQLPQLIPDQYWSARADTCPTPEGIHTCPGADVIGGLGPLLFHDINATLTTPAYHALASGLNIGDATLVAAGRFSERIGHAALFFNNRYWVIGGGEPQLPTNLAVAPHRTLADVWSSPDGKTWKLETDAAAFGPRWFHQAVVFKGAMWVISGARMDANTLTNFLTDVWSSTDGINWTQRAVDIQLPWYSTHLNVTVFNGEMWAVSGGTSFASSDGVTWTRRSATGAIDGGARGYASLTVFNGGLVYIGGSANPNADPAFARHDIWSSTDGINWFLVDDNPPFSKRLRHAAFVMNGKLWVLGGQVPDGAGGTQWALDAWSSSNSSAWTKELTGGLGATYLAQVVQRPDRVTLIGGIQRGYSNNVWQTTNGNDWTELSAHAQFSPRATRGVSFGGHVWIIGGATAESTGGARSNEIWRSDDGTQWTRVATQGTIFSPRDGHCVVVFGNKLWVIGGWDGEIGAGGTETRLNDVWSSDDGVTWTKHDPTGGVIFAPVVGHDVVAFQNKLWVIAGNVQNDTDSSEVWSSDDGDTWTPVTQVHPFPARRSHRVVEFNGEMWMIAGARDLVLGADEGTSDIWHSADGANWTAESAGYPPRARHGLEVFNGRMYMIGGLSSEKYLNSTIYNDVWSSADGVQWQQETPVTPFPPRWNTALIHHGTELWMVGGYGLSFRNDVWRSSDAKTWHLGFSHEMVVP